MKTIGLHRDEGAQALIEFAIFGVLAVTVFLGIVDFSRFLYYDSAIRSAARVGALVGSQHCAYPGCTNFFSDVVPDSQIMFAAYCEAKANVTLTPAYSSCTPAATPPCVGSCTNCTTDICVSPGDTRTTSPPTSFTVSVGYSFKPISFVIDGFFPEQPCYGTDNTATNHHTLCANSTGRVG
jgi:TadE-like protein